MNLDSIMMDFRDFISRNWFYISNLDRFDESDSLRIDWLQVNWEMLVERQVANSKIILEPYGDGADNGKSSRIQDIHKIPNHIIRCISKKNSLILDSLNDVEIDLQAQILAFDRFATLKDNGWYYEEPPFDKVLCFLNEKEVIIDVQDIEFRLQPL